MGKQIGPFKIEGRTFGRLVFYKMDGNYYVRTKSSLTGKRVKKDPRFRRTMRSADQLGRASKIGSAVYNALPKDFRQFWMYRAFTGEAMMMLKKGMQELEIEKELMRIYVEKPKPVSKVQVEKAELPKTIKDTSSHLTHEALELYLNNAARETPEPNLPIYLRMMLAG